MRLSPALLCLSLVLLLSACKPDGAQNGAAAGGGMGAGMPPAPVTTIHPEKKQIEDWTDVSGRFDAVNTAQVRARVSGYLTGVHFKDGDMVQKGQLLFTIDPKQSSAALNESQANLNLAKTQLDLAQRELDRATDLLSTGDVSKNLYDQRQQARDAASASVRAAQARVDTMKLDVGYTQVRAPISGKIGRSLVDLGNLVQGDAMGQATLLTTIVTVDPIYYYFTIDEASYLKYSRMKSTQNKDIAINVALSDETGYPHAGTLDFIDNAMDGGSATVKARAVFENKDGLLVAGLFGRGRVMGGGVRDAVLVPETAVVTDQDRKMLMTVAPDGTVVPKPVTQGNRFDDGTREIRDGVTDADQVIVNGLQRAIPGMKVAPTLTTLEKAMQPEMPAAPQQKDGDKAAK